jgi:lysophospholipase L1-like esterase
MKIEQQQKLVIIGDSITDTGRSRPIGEGRNDALGKGYVLEIDALLGSFYPELGIRVANVGSSGNTVRDLKARWQTDVLDLKPDWLGIMIGANDVWRQHDLPWLKERHVCLEEYETILDELCAQTRSSLKGLVLIAPFFIEPNRQDAMRAMMDRYGAAMKKIASKHSAIFIDTQAAFDEALKHYYSATLSWDRVHPNHIGHMIIAKAFLKGIEFDFTNNTDD